MTADSQQQPESDPSAGDAGVADSVRAAVERTMRATAGSAATTRDRAADLVDEVVRRGRDARAELARRSQEAGAQLTRRGQVAGAELARRGQEATGEVGKRLEALERRLAEVESNLASERAARAEDEAAPERKANPTAEG
jgi:polyhydroxyalkanoate synthesis regulator phasin